MVALIGLIALASLRRRGERSSDATTGRFVAGRTGGEVRCFDTREGEFVSLQRCRDAGLDVDSLIDAAEQDDDDGDDGELGGIAGSDGLVAGSDFDAFGGDDQVEDEESIEFERRATITRGKAVS